MDKSGDAGFKFHGGSSRFFVIAAVIFDSNFAADACDRSIDELKSKIGFRHAREFRFSDVSDKVRNEVSAAWPPRRSFTMRL